MFGGVSLIATFWVCGAKNGKNGLKQAQKYKTNVKIAISVQNVVIRETSPNISNLANLAS